MTPWYSRAMLRSLLPILVAVSVSACGGTSKPSTPPAPLPPEPAVAEQKPAEQPPAEPAEPPVPPGPMEVTVPSADVQVKLVSAGKGKKAPLKLTPTAGATQATELALDFTGGQEAPAELGGKQDEVAPTVLIAANVETQEVDANGHTRFQMTVSGVDTKDKPGQKVSSQAFKEELGTLIGAKIEGTVGPNGAMGPLKLVIDKPDAKSEGALAFVRLSLMPLWPVLPNEAVGTGAKWKVTSTQKIADQLEVKKVVDYELVSKKGNAYTIKGTTKISGEEQTVQGAKLGSITGNGSTEVTLAQGALLPTTKQNMATNFTITVTPPPEAPAGSQPVEIKFHVEQANALTPKA